MAAPRRVIEVSIGDEELAWLERIARSRTEPACRVARARMLLAYPLDPSGGACGGAKHKGVNASVRAALSQSRGAVWCDGGTR